MEYHHQHRFYPLIDAQKSDEVAWGFLPQATSSDFFLSERRRREKSPGGRGQRGVPLQIKFDNPFRRSSPG